MDIKNLKTYTDIENYIDKLQTRIKFLKDDLQGARNINEILNQENLSIKKEHNELKDKYNKFLSEIKIKDKQIEEFKIRIDGLEQLVEKRTFIKKTRQISDSQIAEIKDLRDSGMSYREIANATGWSKFTIGKVIHGDYDNILTL